MSKNTLFIYEVTGAMPYEARTYFITRLNVVEFDSYLNKTNPHWLCYEWIGYINREHKVIKDGGSSRYWFDGTITNR